MISRGGPPLCICTKRVDDIDVSKTANHCSNGDFYYLMQRIIYCKRDNLRVKWGEHSSIWRWWTSGIRYLHSSSVFWSRPPRERLAGGWPGNCLDWGGSLLGFGNIFFSFIFCRAALRPTWHSNFGLDLAIGHGRKGWVYSSGLGLHLSHPCAMETHCSVSG